MGDPRLAVWKYQHDHPNPWSARDRTRVAVAVAGVVALAAAGAAVAFGVGAGEGPLAAGFVASWIGTIALVLTVRRVRPRRVIAVGPRYLICGSEIMYFGNVTSAVLDRHGGRLRLSTTAGHTFLLEQRRFPTGARKPHKIAANTAAKFGKVADRIMAAVRQAAPDAAITEGRV